jgi:hypothetical protein
MQIVSLDGPSFSGLVPTFMLLPSKHTGDQHVIRQGSIIIEYNMIRI